MSSTSLLRNRVVAIVAALTAMVLAGCQGTVTVDLSSNPAADPQVSDVIVDVAGLEFERADGTTQKLEFTSATQTDLVSLAQNDLRMFTDESLEEGTYTGVRLLIEDNESASVSRSDGTEYPLVVAEGDYTAIDFTVTEDESSRENLALTLDLRKSLSFNEDELEYTLTPTLRAVRTDEAAQITGGVDIDCPVGESLEEGGAVYLFSGEDVTPDDIGSSVSAYATAAVNVDFFAGQRSYALRLLPPGDYTIALTCNGHEDDPATDDDIDFIGTTNVQIDEGEALELDLN